MNKMILKILVILGLIAPVCADAVYKRIDSPGVAQRKLNLLLKNVKEMSASQRKQAVADLSPSLKEYYEEMLKVPSGRSEKLDNALLVVKRAILDLPTVIKEMSCYIVVAYNL